MRCAGLLLAILAALDLPLSAQERVPEPSAWLGMQIGADSILADWTEIGRYLASAALASPVVRLDTIGNSTLGKPLLMVTFASERNMLRLEQLKRWQARLADPRTLSAATEDSLVATAPVVVLINNNIHSNEIASSQMQLEMTYLFATHPVWRGWLDSVVVLMIPSANPDGLDMMVDWYHRYKGTPYEGGPLPWLYHHYVGHDNNRDWYMLTQVETRAITRVLYHEWFPQVVWDVHQMGATGARFFVPPFSDPVNPNLDPMLVQATNLAGMAMGSAILDAGHTGVSFQDRFDLWWHGGFRTVPARHNMVGILSEAASARLASPRYVESDSLRQPSTGVNFPAPWPGGLWRMRDIIDYELRAAEGLLRLASAERSQFVRRFVTLGRRAVAQGETTSPSAFLIPEDQRDRRAAAELVNALLLAGVEIHRATSSFTTDGVTHPAGTLVIPMAQPFRAHAKDLLERQQYPDRRQHPGGPSIPPYDVSGWTLGLQMGVTVIETGDHFTFTGTRIREAAVAPGSVTGTGPQTVLANRSNAESRTIIEVLAAGGRAWVQQEPVTVERTTLPAGSVVLEGPGSGELVARAAAEYGFDAWRTSGIAAPGKVVTSVPRIGLYRPWTASMDEGWTRWVFERHGIPFTNVTDSMIRSGNLRAEFDVFVLPSASTESITDGRSEDETPPEYAGGIGEEGTANLVEFVRAGGTLVALDAASDFAIEALNLPVTNVLADEGDVPRAERFSAPGSIFAVDRLRGDRFTSGVPDTVAVFFRNSRAFAVEEPAQVVASYADEPLLSGFVRYPERVAGRGALVVAPSGDGRAVLFGFRPQHRAQTHGTFKLLFNALLFGN